MDLVYGLTEGNASRAQRIFRDKYPNCLGPHATTFSMIPKRLCKKGLVVRDGHAARRSRTPTLEEALLHDINRATSRNQFQDYCHKFQQQPYVSLSNFKTTRSISLHVS